MTEKEAPSQPVTIKKYANRRLYNTATSAYVTLENLSEMVKQGIEFNVYDAKTGEDLTRGVLTQVIVEEEGKSGQQNLLPTSFLRQLIGFYGDNMQWMVPKYLEHSMQVLANNQDQLRQYFQQTFGNMFPFSSTLEDMSKQNLAMFENTMKLFTTFMSADSVCTCSDTSCECTKVDVSSCETPVAAVQEETEEVEEPKEKIKKTETPAACTVAPSVEPAPAPVTPLRRVETQESPRPAATPMPNVQSATATSAATGVNDMQQKIANLQKQLAELAKNRA